MEEVGFKHPKNQEKIELLNRIAKGKGL